MLISDEKLGKIIYESYRYIWIFFGSMFISQYINYFVSLVSNNISFLSYILGFILAELIEITLGKTIRKIFIQVSEHSKKHLINDCMVSLMVGRYFSQLLHL